MNSYNYIDQVNENLLCCICRAPFLEPLRARTCSHTFCQECIFTALRVSQHCPIDRCLLRMDDLSSADPLVRNLVDELMVECPKRDAGCLHTCQRQLLAAHLKESCMYVDVPCQDGKCDSMVLRKNASHDMHCSDAKGCDLATDGEYEEGNLKKSCEDCNSELAESDLSTHRATCPEAVITCPQVINGCPWNGRRAQQGAHASTCPYEAIKGFFPLFSAQVTTLKSENTVLRSKVSALEGTICSLRYELGVMQRALGPWYRQDLVSDPLASSSRYTTDMMPDMTMAHYAEPPPEHHAGQPTSPRSHEASATSTSRRLPSASATELPDFASYFPPADEEDDLLSHSYAAHTSAVAPSQLASPTQSYTGPYNPHQGNIPHPLSIPSGSTTQYQSQSVPSTSLGVQLPSSPPRIPPVAPLNISTTLEGTLYGLRESIVTLSSAVDSLARRQDVALSTEAMRTAEEIRSLRVVIHGLRMQVHSMMMDRNAQVGERPDSSGAIPWVSPPEMPIRPGEGLSMPWLNLPYGPRYPPPPPSSIPKL